MTLPLWGNMQMSQEDPRTIAEYIADMIVEHGADPVSHLGEGESLSVHKTDSVIDHPAGSILADKFSRREIFVDSPFQSLDSFQTYGSTFNFFPGFGIANDWESTGYSGVYFFLQRPFNLPLNLLDYTFRTEASYEVYETGNFLQFGIFTGGSIESSTMILNGIYFSIEDRVLKGRVKYGDIDTVVTLRSAEEHVDLMQYEITFNYGTKTIQFYVDGELLGSVDVSAVTGNTGTPYIAWRLYAENEENQVIGSFNRIQYALESPL